MRRVLAEMRILFNPRNWLLGVLMLAVQLASAVTTTSAQWNYRDEMMPRFVQEIPAVLASQDHKTGRFGTGVWVPDDQNEIWTLAVAWATKHPANPYYHSKEVLEAIMAGGDALIDEQTSTGAVMFRRKDGSVWGASYNPWPFSRWIQAYSLIRDAMPAPRRAKWEKALSLAFTHIDKSEIKRVHNIPSYLAMSLYCAGKSLNRPDWCTTASTFMHEVADHQSPDGYWSEHSGPVVGYNYVYSHALGNYYAMSHDSYVLPALERAARFHANCTYPNGANLETIDERMIYDRRIIIGNVGLSFSAIGRGHIRHQWELAKNDKDSTSLHDQLSFLIANGGDGPLGAVPADSSDGQFVLGKGDALIRRQGPWFLCLSAFHCPVSDSRWIQDRQNLASLYHADAGLILGGGDSKLTPLWSTFTAGNTALLYHKPGDQSPDFIPPPGIAHVPTGAQLKPEELGLDLDYGGQKCKIGFELLDNRKARIRVSAASVNETTAVAAHLTFLPVEGASWSCASGKSGRIEEAAPFRLSAADAGGSFTQSKWSISLSPGSEIVWPAYGHDQYKKDGAPSFRVARIVLSIPLTKKNPARDLALEIADPGKEVAKP